MSLHPSVFIPPFFFFSEYSMQLNASRIKVLQAQDDLVNEMKEEAVKALLNVSKGHHHLLEFLHLGHHNNFYQHLVKELIVQVIIYVCPSIS
jgi:V-type H+-transporting ATPase subunit E